MLRMFKSIALYFMYFVSISYELIRYTIQRTIGFDTKPITADLSPKIALQIPGIHAHESNHPQPLVSFFLSLIPVESEGDDSINIKAKTSYTDKGIVSEFKFLYDGPQFTLITLEDGIDTECDEDVFNLDKYISGYDRVVFESGEYSIYALNSPLFMFTALSGHSPNGLLEFYIHKENKNKGLIIDKLSGYREGFISVLQIDSTAMAGVTQQENQDNLAAPPWYAFFSVKSELFHAIEESGCSGYLNVSGQMIPLSQP